MAQCLGIDFVIKEISIRPINKEGLITPGYVYEEQKILIRMKNKLHG